MSYDEGKQAESKGKTRADLSLLRASNANGKGCRSGMTRLMSGL